MKQQWLLFLLHHFVHMHISQNRQMHFSSTRKVSSHHFAFYKVFNCSCSRFGIKLNHKQDHCVQLFREKIKFNWHTSTTWKSQDLTFMQHAEATSKQELSHHYQSLHTIDPSIPILWTGSSVQAYSFGFIFEAIELSRVYMCSVYGEVRVSYIYGCRLGSIQHMDTHVS